MPKKIITKSQSRKYKKRSLKNMNGGANASATGITGKNLILGKEYDNSDTSKGNDNNFYFKYDKSTREQNRYSVINNKLFQNNIPLGEIMCGKILIIDNINTSKLIDNLLKKGIYIIQSVKSVNWGAAGFYLINIDSINSYLNN
jgi:hypothetical protein